MTTAIAPIRISEKWLQQQATFLACAAPGPAKDSLAKEIEEARQTIAARDAFEAWVKATQGGAVLNAYPFRVAGVTHQPGKVFVKKGDRQFCLTVAEAWELYCKANA